MGYWDHMGQYGGWMGAGWLAMLLFWVLLIVAIVLAVKWLARPGPPTETREKTARDILDERYARGEIERDEYEQKKSDLKKQ